MLHGQFRGNTPFDKQDNANLLRSRYFCIRYISVEAIYTNLMPKKPRDIEHLETFVTVNSKSFTYTEVDGLDSNAVCELTPFIYSEALKFLHAFPGCSLDLEDLLNEGHYGAIKAARRYDPSRGVQFITFAAFSIRSAMREAVGEGMIHTPRGKKSVPVDLMDTKDLAAIEVLDQGDLADDLERIDLWNRVMLEVRTLPEEKASLLLRWASGETLAEIAKERLFSRQRASQILRESILKIRGAMAA